jgi:hypothetical protein
VARRRRTPQEKKRLAYERDFRGAYRGSAHGARTSVPRNKRLRARAERRNATLALPGDRLPADVDAAMDRAEARLHRPRDGWQKDAGRPLGEHVAGVLGRRAEHEAVAGLPVPDPAFYTWDEAARTFGIHLTNAGGACGDGLWVLEHPRKGTTVGTARLT